MDPIVKILIRSLHRDYYAMLDALIQVKVDKLPLQAFMKKTM